MDVLLNNRDDAEESLPAFDNAFITLDNSMVKIFSLKGSNPGWFYLFVLPD